MILLPGKPRINVIKSMAFNYGALICPESNTLDFINNHKK